MKTDPGWTLDKAINQKLSEANGTQLRGFGAELSKRIIISRTIVVCDFG